MAYTRAWTTTTPADTDQASTLGAVTRNLRTDIEERMNTLLDGHWGDDPVGGYPRTIVDFYSAQAGRESGSGWSDLVASGDSMQPSGPAAANKKYQIRLQPGAIITKVRAACFIKAGSAGVPNIKIASIYTVVEGGGQAETALAITSANPTADTAWHWMDCAMAPYTVIAGTSFVVFIQGNTGAGGVSFDVRFAGIEVTYTKPNLLVGN